MSLNNVKALTFDTGGTILDWHSGFRDALAAAGARYGVERDWAFLTNELRKRSLGAMLNLGEHEPPAYNFDGAHRMKLDEILAEEGLDVFTEEDRHAIAYDAVHKLTVWPDFPAVLPELQKQRIVVSFTLLSYRITIDTAKHNGFTWDAVMSCEGYGFYKLLPQAYLKTAEMLQLEPSECCMVACHPFDLNAAQKVGFKTALVRRPMEWGGPDAPNQPDFEAGEYDVMVDSFPELLAATS